MLAASPTLRAANQCVVITGGNRGIGLAYSRAIAKVGVRVAMIFKQSQNAPDIAKDLKDEFKIDVRAYQCDVTDAEKTIETFNRIENEMGPIKGLIANAGMSVMKPALELTSDDFRKVFSVNVLGVFNSCRAAAKIWMRRSDKRARGSIVITSSMSASIINQAGPNMPLTQAFYNSSKAAVSNLTKGLAAEWACEGIRVNAVCPGYVETDQTKHMKDEILKHQRENVPLQKFAKPDEITGQALLLLSEHASYMTGGEYLVDGGQLIW